MRTILKFENSAAIIRVSPIWAVVLLQTLYGLTTFASTAIVKHHTENFTQDQNGSESIYERSFDYNDYNVDYFSGGWRDTKWRSGKECADKTKDEWMDCVNDYLRKKAKGKAGKIMDECYKPYLKDAEKGISCVQQYEKQGVDLSGLYIPKNGQFGGGKSDDKGKSAESEAEKEKSKKGNEQKAQDQDPQASEKPSESSSAVTTKWTQLIYIYATICVFMIVIF